jgi:hypothetical protein
VENNNVHAANATLTAGTLAKIRTRGMNKGIVCSNEEVWYQPLTKVGPSCRPMRLPTISGRGSRNEMVQPRQRSRFRRRLPGVRVTQQQFREPARHGPGLSRRLYYAPVQRLSGAAIQ